MPFLQLVTAHPVPASLAESLAGAFGRALGLPPGAVIVQRVASGPGPAEAVVPAGTAVPALAGAAEVAETTVSAPAGAAEVAGTAVSAPAGVADAAGSAGTDVPGGTTTSAEAVQGSVVDAGAVIVVRGRPREVAAMREAVARAGTLLAEGLGLDPDLVLVSWPDPGVVATGRGVLQ